MDKDFKDTNNMYLSQRFVEDENDEQLIAECRMQASAYAFTENAIVSMGDNKLNCSYCYFGGLADVLGLTEEERLNHVRERWECMHNCELCGKCHILKGRDAETLYADYIEGKRSYMEITLEIRK